jgi:transposase InsO family protein
MPVFSRRISLTAPKQAIHTIIRICCVALRWIGRTRCGRWTSPTRPSRGFIYLAAVMDWFSRRVLSWRVSITMDDPLLAEGDD